MVTSYSISESSWLWIRLNSPQRHSPQIHSTARGLCTFQVLFINSCYSSKLDECFGLHWSMDQCHNLTSWTINSDLLLLHGRTKRYSNYMDSEIILPAVCFTAFKIIFHCSCIHMHARSFNSCCGSHFLWL